MLCDKLSIERTSIPGDGFSVPCVRLTPSDPAGAAVIVHGYGGCKEEQLGLAMRVAEAGLVACSIDLRGHGEHKLQMDDNVMDDVNAAIGHCRQFGRVTAVGHSMGGRLSLLSDADHKIAISPAFTKTYNAQTLDTLKSLRSYRVHEPTPGKAFDVLQNLPVWQGSEGERPLIIYGSRDVRDIMSACEGLVSEGVPVVRIDMALHADIFLLEETMDKVTVQLSKWYKN